MKSFHLTGNFVVIKVFLLFFAQALLSTQQVKAVSSYRRALTERKRAELQERVHKALQEAEGGCANRDVTPVWKLSVADSNDLHSSRGERSPCVLML